VTSLVNTINEPLGTDRHMKFGVDISKSREGPSGNRFKRHL